MKHFYLLSIFVLTMSNVFSQGQFRYSESISPNFAKQPLDTGALTTWPFLHGSVSITNDGKYFMYGIYNQPVKNCTFIVKATNSLWEKHFILKRYPYGFFSEDSKLLIFGSQDTLYFLSLGTDESHYISNVISYKHIHVGTEDWLAYQLNNANKDLILYNVPTRNERRFHSVLDYSLSDSNNVLLITTESKQDSLSISSLDWVVLSNGKSLRIWSGSSSPMKQSRIISSTFNLGGDQLAFIVQEQQEDHILNSLWYFNHSKMKTAAIKFDDRSLEIQDSLSITNSTPVFSKNGKYIFFGLQAANSNRSPLAVKGVDIWNYKEEIIQGEQFSNEQPRLFEAVTSIDDARAIRLERADEIIDLLDMGSDFALINNDHPTSEIELQPWWNGFNRRSYYLVSFKDGSRKLLNWRLPQWLPPYIFASPLGKYLVYFDSRKHHYFSYDMNSGITRNISIHIPRKVSEEDNFLTGKLMFDQADPVGNAGWLEEDSGLLIYDNYDIWEVDPSGKRLPINITNSYGLLHHIKLRLVEDSPIIHKGQQLLIMAFNTKNKYNGFYRKTLGMKGNPELLTMGPYAYDFIGSGLSEGMKPVKAANADCWIIRRQTASEAPNLFLTKDFKRYDLLTDFHPQKAYNWLSAELVDFRQLDGTSSQGILYRPEDFDPHKKYPIIFYYYEQLSQDLYLFPNAGYSSAIINIPWYVSHGYLVFTPDIHYKVGATGQSVVNTVVSAAEMLASKPWVNVKCMGIEGHSFGGYETNYLITHSHLFAAAASAEGISDLISDYGGLRGIDGEGTSNEFHHETGQFRIGATLWQQPGKYIENSPIFNLDKVTTPILIMNNKKDAAVAFAQGIELFMGLRRLGKKAWMLQYDGEGHILTDKQDESDYTLRLNQFFDYYLKGSLPPKWMTEGVPLSKKGIDAGLELDTSGRTP